MREQRFNLPDNILVVDDESRILTLAKMILEKAGYQVVTAANGDEALIKVETERPDLIILDIVMPGKTGLEICKILRSHPKNQMIPIILFSVLGRESDKKLGDDAGADNYLIKPFTPDTLIMEVNKQLKKNRKLKFSKTIGTTHDKIQGHKMLMEVNPVSPYERIVRDFALESLAHREKTIAITLIPSPIYSALQNEKNIEFISLSKANLTHEITSYTEKRLAFIFDNLNDLLLSNSHNSTSKTLKKSLASFINSNATGLFLFNPYIHTSQEVFTIRHLFNDRIIWGEDGFNIVSI
jgi:DNA-binding response OmpR family regulator